ncbi:MAG: glycerol-3-phosphate dehydrogenase C-terminal domain-containing protein, partial [Bacteroidota bacterium]
ASELSRKDEIFISDSGLISIAGGKLTGFRKMAKRVVDLCMKRLTDIPFTPCQTKNFLIHAEPFTDYQEYKTLINSLYKEYREEGLTHFQVSYLMTTYGKHAIPILEKALTNQEGELATKLVEAQLDYCTAYESIYYPQDFFIRRTGWLYFQIHHLRKHLSTIIRKLGQSYTWDVDTQTHMFTRSEQTIQRNMVQRTHDPLITN